MVVVFVCRCPKGISESYTGGWTDDEVEIVKEGAWRHFRLLPAFFNLLLLLDAAVAFCRPKHVFRRSTAHFPSFNIHFQQPPLCCLLLLILYYSLLYEPSKMNLNYHEMTMNEPRDSPQKRKQFLVICSVMVTALSYAVMTSGVMLPLEAQEGIFPGGNFCYKLAHRDYAASMGLGRRITSDVTGIKFPTNTESKPVEEILYHLYLDNPLELSGRRLRWASGILVGDSSQDKVEKLMALNAKGKRYPTPEEFADLSASEVMEMYPYELVDLPSVDSLVAQFPNTHGFVSALVMSYKVRFCCVFFTTMIATVHHCF